jgi:phage regulator Rha-like protein
MQLELSHQELAKRIYFIRGHRVMLDSDLAELYQVEAKALNKAVRRNLDRFPDDFMFQLTDEEFQSLRSQTGTLKTGRGQHRKYLPLVFTEQGVTMLASVLRSERAVQVSISVVRAFVKLRELLASHKGLADKLAEMEQKYDSQFKIVFDAIRQLMAVGSPLTQRKIRTLGEFEPEL